MKRRINLSFEAIEAIVAYDFGERSGTGRSRIRPGQERTGATGDGRWLETLHQRALDRPGIGRLRQRPGFQTARRSRCGRLHRLG